MEDITCLPLIAEMIEESVLQEEHCLSIQTVSIFLKQLNLNVMITTGQGNTLSLFTTLILDGIHHLLSKADTPPQQLLFNYSSDK